MGDESFKHRFWQKRVGRKNDLKHITVSETEAAKYSFFGSLAGSRLIINKQDIYNVF